MRSQKEQILKYLKTGKTLTSMEALIKFGCFRLGARIWDLKKDGIKICSELKYKNGKSFSEYRLKK